MLFERRRREVIAVVPHLLSFIRVSEAPSLNSSLRAFDLDCDVVDDYFDHQFEFLVVSSDGGEVVA